MSQNGPTNFKNVAALNARFLKCVWPFWELCINGLRIKIYEEVKMQFSQDFLWWSSMNTILLNVNSYTKVYYDLNHVIFSGVIFWLILKYNFKWI